MSHPHLILHADWSLHPRKRVMAVAVRKNGRFHLHAPEPVGDLATLFARLRARMGGQNGRILFGVDFPIGLPLAYAQNVGITDFLTWLPQAGAGEWVDFYRVAQEKSEIVDKRPFYPQTPGGSRRQHLVDGLSVSHFDALRRQCDLARPGRRAAAPLFWTMGAQQVGKAAISGWRDLIVPWLHDARVPLAIWPFSGQLAALFRENGIVLAEAYPAEMYDWLGVRFGAGAGKRQAAARQQNSAALLTAAAEMALVLSEGCKTAVLAGFGTAAAGEDAFDALVGVLGLMQVVLGKRPLFEPAEPAVRLIEGWILGQSQ